MIRQEWAAILAHFASQLDRAAMSKPTPADRRDDSWQAAQQGRRRAFIAKMGTEGTSVSLPPTGDPSAQGMKKDIELQDK